MTNKRSRKTAPERAEIIFSLYHQLGPERSLRRLHWELQALGVRIGLATIKRYSVRFGWQRRADDLEAEAVRRQRERTIGDLLAMQDRHAQLARALQGAGGTALQKLMTSEPRLGKMSASDIARLVEAGLKAERHAVGEATDRREIAVETWNSVTTEMVAVFNEVNDDPDPVARARLFARGVDRAVDRYLAEVTDSESLPDGR